MRQSVDAVHRWLATGQDVLVRGDDGSGRSSVLEAVRTATSHRRVVALLLRASGDTRFAALLGHASAPRDGSAGTGQALVDWLADELGGPGALLLVDDVDQLDDGTAAVVLEAVRRTRCAVVMSSGRDLTRPGTGRVGALLAQSAPAEVRVLPLGFGAMTGLVSSALGAVPDVSLVSAVTARSAGNPRVALAVVRAARFAGAIRCVDGRWTKVRPLDEAPLDAVAHALLSRLDDAQVEVLEHVAQRCAVEEDELDPGTVARLLARGRLVVHPAGDALATLVVSPPALASALRQRRGRGARPLMTTRGCPQRLDDERAPERAPAGLGRLLLAERGPDDADYWRVAAQLTSLVQERSATAESAARAVWLRAPTVPHANAYLALLMRRSATDLVEAVLRDTLPRDDDPAAETEVHRLFEARWAAFRGESVADVRRRLGPDSRRLDPFLSLHERRDLTVAGLRSPGGAGPVPRTPDEEGELPLHLRGWSWVAQAAGALEAGRPDVTAALCAQADRLELVPEVRHHLAGLRGEALLMLDDVRGAERWARDQLERSLDALDTSGIRVHACVLAQVLMFAGRPHGAWRTISTSLRLGPPGPLEDSYYRRTLVLGATLQVRSGALPVAQILTAELDGIPRGPRPLIRSMRVLAHAALEVAQGEDVDASDRMWARGERYARDGQVQPALLCWLLSAVPMDDARLAEVRAAWQQVELPLLTPFLRLHEALAADDAEAALDAFPAGRTWIAAGLARCAQSVVDDRRRGRSSRTPSARPAVERAPADGGSGRLSLQVEVLSEREREVALLARAGLSNRQIAARLVLSVRTVENHMSRALRKLGYTNRAELDLWSEL